MSVSFCLRQLKNRIMRFLTVPPVHEDPYVNAILNTKVSKEEALNTCYLLFVDPIVRFAQERPASCRRRRIRSLRYCKSRFAGRSYRFHRRFY